MKKNLLLLFNTKTNILWCQQIIFQVYSPNHLHYIRNAGIVPEFVQAIFRHFSQLFDQNDWSTKWDKRLIKIVNNFSSASAKSIEFRVKSKVDGDKTKKARKKNFPKSLKSYCNMNQDPESGVCARKSAKNLEKSENNWENEVLLNEAQGSTKPTVYEKTSRWFFFAFA